MFIKAGLDACAMMALSDLLVKARKRFKPSELERIEESFSLLCEPGEQRRSHDPLQRPLFYFPGLMAKPFHDPQDFEAVTVLKASYEVIKRELLNLLHQQSGFKPYFEPALVSVGAWNAFYFRVGNLNFEENWRRCPKTTGIIESLPRFGEMALFSALAARTHLTPHCGRWNFRLTIHLGLIVPEGCELRVASETRRWEEGECIVFDDSFEHEAWNRSESARVCLLIDIWHPELTPVEMQLLNEASNILWADLRL